MQKNTKVTPEVFIATTEWSLQLWTMCRDPLTWPADWSQFRMRITGIPAFMSNLCGEILLISNAFRNLTGQMAPPVFGLLTGVIYRRIWFGLTLKLRGHETVVRPYLLVGAAHNRPFVDPFRIIGRTGQFIEALINKISKVDNLAWPVKDQVIRYSHFEGRCIMIDSRVIGASVYDREKEILELISIFGLEFFCTGLRLVKKFNPSQNFKQCKTIL